MVRFERPFKNVADIYMEVKPVSENSSVLIWNMNGKNKYPFNLMNLFIPDMLGKDMAESLETLKNKMES
ncbi:MAG TPA: hypothetical protein VHA56_13720 [Mucilaginibacter sp.]|nr:hypothetical protein [Mucilaginibacter sp.]